MINLRYHLVAVTAVFLAVALGLALGAAAPSGAGDDRAVRGGSDGWQRGQVRQLSSQRRDDDFDRRLAPRALAGTLRDRAVLVLALPGADAAAVAGTGRMLDEAGASPTGTVRLTSTFTDPANSDALGDLATAKLPVDIDGRIPDNGDGVESAAALLAAVLMSGGTPVSSDSRTTVLTAYATGGNLVLGHQVTGAADAVVIVCGRPATGRDAARRNAAALTVVRGFAAAGPTVVAGAGTSGAGNLVAAVRGDHRLVTTVSTVDTVDRVRGRITTALAVAAQLSGTVGRYGTAKGASDQLPEVRTSG